ncbi:FkbM family methyltransferase [Butyrivibrio hungatei]|uniref:SAM-dependent methyltransferase n=1 Tax=Butyrivibrio hungatei TaxID=185008 RepID=A0A1D9P417_9FIRM|nr:FkbM family methyltransferase [Butyrivibrio hungatei]AOZ97320.1 SAM-dependent methyltransferase [Butyrivibrio hungatei]
MKSTEEVYLYGLGQFFESNRDFLHQKYKVAGYIDKNRRGKIEGVPIKKPSDDINRNKKVVVCVVEIKLFLEISKELEDLGYSHGKIIYAANDTPLLQSDIKVYPDVENSFLLEYNGHKSRISNIEEYWGFIDVFKNEVYYFSLFKEAKYIVFDVGMNTGDSVIYFSYKTNVKKVYSWEPFRETYNFGLSNIRDYANSKCIIECMNYGLGADTRDEKINYFRNFSTSMSSVYEITDLFQNQLGVEMQDDSYCTCIKIKKSSEEIQAIMNANKGLSYILKLDCEGAEYEIMGDLFEQGLLQLFDAVMVEWHYKGSKNLEKYLIDSGFAIFGYKKSETIGILNAVNLCKSR